MRRSQQFRMWCGKSVWVCFLFGSVLFSQAVLEAHRTQVSISLSPRPSEGSPRKEDVMFDHKASLKIKMANVGEPSSDIKIQWVFLYDDIETSGKIKRGQLMDTIGLALGKGEEKTVESKELRLSGKISKKGQLTGMRYSGYGVRVYDAGKLVFEDYQPQNLKKEIAELCPVLSPPAVVTAPAPKPVAETSTAATATAEVKPAVPAGVVDQSGGVTILESTFSKEEAEALLKVVNEFSEDDLILKVGLVRQAAHNLVLKRPFQNIEDLPKVSYVKKTAMSSFKKYVEKK